MNNGFFLVHRRLFDHEVGQDPKGVALWVRLLSEASFEDKKIYFDGISIDLRRGQLITSVKKLADWLQVSRTKANRTLECLKEIHQIDIKKTNKYTIITILNYDKYQVDVQQKDIKKTTERHQKDTSNKYNKNNKYNISSAKPKKGLRCPLELKEKYPYLNTKFPKGHSECIEFIEAVQEEKGHKFVNMGKQIGALHGILRAGFDFDHMNVAIDTIKKDRFYQEKGWDFTTIAQFLEKKGGTYGR